MLRRLLRASYEIQARVHSHEAPPRELVDIAERAILEVAHEDRRKDFRAIDDVLDAEIDKLEQLSREGKAITGTPSGFEDLDAHHRRLPARQPDHPRRAPVDGQVGADGQLRRERRARRGKKAVALFSLEMSESRARPALHRVAGVDQGRRPAQGQACPQSRWGKILEASNRLAKSPLFIDDSSDLSVLDVRAKARRLLQQHADGLGLILIDYLQLMRARRARRTTASSRSARSRAGSRRSRASSTCR